MTLVAELHFRCADLCEPAQGVRVPTSEEGQVGQLIATLDLAQSLPADAVVTCRAAIRTPGVDQLAQQWMDRDDFPAAAFIRSM